MAAVPHSALDETMAATSESSDSLRFRVSKLGGEEQDVQVERNCSLGEFKSMLVGRGLAKEGLAVDFIVEGVLMNLSRGATIGELNLAEDSHLVVITRRSHDYGQIREVQCMVKSHQWPQGVLTTTEGHLYVCHWGGQLQVYDLELKLLRETVLKSPPVVHPSQMAMAPSGELVMACWDGSVAVVDSGTLELVRMIPTAQRQKSTGLAIQEEELFVSHLGSGQIDVFNLQTGQHLRYISVNPVNGAISVSMDDAHYVAILAPPIQSD
eukprot:s1376_g8.t2